MKTTRWRINDQFRKRQRQVGKGSDNTSETDRTATIARIPDPRGDELEAIWERGWKQTIFERALERVKRTIPANHYQIFDLYAVKEWPAEKVARMFSVSSGQVFLIKSRVLAQVRKEVARLDKEIL